MIKLAFLFLTLLATPLISSAQQNNYLAGLAAYQSRDYAKAIPLLTPYAEQGDCYAQYAVGFAYWSDKSDSVNDSIAEAYLMSAAEKKQTHAMGILGTILALKAMHDPDLAPNALMWAELAAMYDPIQAATTTRAMIRSYLEAFQVSQAERLIEEKRKIFDVMEPCAPKNAKDTAK